MISCCTLHSYDYLHLHHTIDTLSGGSIPSSIIRYLLMGRFYSFPAVNDISSIEPCLAFTGSSNVPF